MCQVLREEIDKASQGIKNTLFGKYALTRYLLMYVVRELLEEDAVGAEAIGSPDKFVRSEDNRAKFRKCIRTLLNDVVIDINAEVKEYGNDFDYRGKLREEAWVTDLVKTMVTDYRKQVARERIPSFSQDWESE